LADVLTDASLAGFCITIPHKKAILGYLTEVTDAVKKMGACNCVRVKEGKLYGYNTDVVGFEQSFAPQLQKHHYQALVLGTGGASAAVEYVLQKLNIPYQLVSRTKSANTITYAELTEAIIQAHPIIINCTPLGTFPKIDECPEIPYQFISSNHYLYDLVYNPPLTKFLALGKANGAMIKNGQDMLTIQAEENWKIWNS
jgi:shikimate dehydrogenase